MKKILLGALAIGSAVYIGQKAKIPDSMRSRNDSKEKREKALCPKCDRVALHIDKGDSLSYKCSHCGIAGIGFRSRHQLVDSIVHQ